MPWICTVPELYWCREFLFLFALFKQKNHKIVVNCICMIIHTGTSMQLQQHKYLSNDILIPEPVIQSAIHCNKSESSLLCSIWFSPRFTVGLINSWRIIQQLVFFCLLQRKYFWCLRINAVHLWWQGQFHPHHIAYHAGWSSMINKLSGYFFVPWTDKPWFSHTDISFSGRGDISH